jgi:MEDS: MEthanogen/methylotroph, DcmR Sensory domain
MAVPPGRYYNVIAMEPIPRHQCLIYEGAPSRQLPALAAMMGEKMRRKYRCLYLNTPPMVAGVRSRLWAQGVDVDAAIAQGDLVLTSERPHLIDGRFDVDHMILLLETAFDDAMRAGHQGLWATGDMTWEMGSDKDFMKLVEYEWRLERFFQKHPEMGGTCQYHKDTLPRQMLRQCLVVHPGIFVSETMQLVNPEYVRPEQFSATTLRNPHLDAALDRLCRPSGN